eukprot:5581823-Prorocentrum_lima.AAC.1
MAGDYYERQDGPLWAEVPTEGIPGVAGGALIRLKKAVYGLGDGPLRWFHSLVQFCEKIGFQASPFDPCLLM